MGKLNKDKKQQKFQSYSKGDIYYRKAKEDGFRARSAYKLIHIDEIYDIFNGVERVIDVCSAPGSWSQYIARRLTEKGLDIKNETRIVSVDLQMMAPIFGVTCIEGDITKDETVNEIITAFKGNKAELVVCDGAPDVTGFHDIDQYIQSQLLVSAMNICSKTILENGTFVTKIFHGSDSVFLKSQFKVFFKQVDIFKPKSSRESSVENFIVAKFYNPPQGFCLTDINTFKVFSKNLIDFERLPKAGESEEKMIEEKKDVEKLNEKIYKYVTCGDLNCFDEDIP